MIAGDTQSSFVKTYSPNFCARAGSTRRFPSIGSFGSVASDELRQLRERTRDVKHLPTTLAIACRRHFDRFGSTNVGEAGCIKADGHGRSYLDD